MSKSGEPANAVHLAPPPPTWVLRTMNLVMRPLLSSRVGGRIEGVILLEFSGRRSGRTYRVPVNRHLVDGTVMAFTDAPWRHNFADGAQVEVTLQGKRRSGRGILVQVTSEEMGVAVRKSLDSGGSAQRMGIKSPRGHEPTAEELAAIGPALGNAVIRFDLDD